MEKRCSKCGETKSVEQFSKDRYAQDGYRYQCKPCIKIYRQSDEGKRADKRYAQSDKGKQTHKRHRQSDKGKRACKRADKRYAQSDKRKQTYKRYRQSDKGKQTYKRYRQSDKGKQSNIKRQAVRSTRKTQAGGSYTIAEWYNLCKFYNFHCLKCDKKFPFEKLTLDHVKPVAKNGPSFIWNTQPLCKKCNSKKGNREIDYRKNLPDWINRDGPVWQQDRLF